MLKKNEYRNLEKKLGYRFRDKSFLTTALLHRSYRFENYDIVTDNQRLEFLGDAVLGFVSAARLYDMFQEDNEGLLTSYRSQITSGKALADLAKEIGVGEYLKVGRGEESSGGKKRASNLADAFESIIGAAYLDGGIKAVNKIFSNLFLPCISGLSADIWADNPKGKLQDYSQRNLKTSPKYDIIKREGPPHATVFTVEARLSDGQSSIGKGLNKQEAESDAAQKMIEKLPDDI